MRLNWQAAGLASGLSFPPLILVFYILWQLVVGLVAAAVYRAGGLLVLSGNSIGPIVLLSAAFVSITSVFLAREHRLLALVMTWAIIAGWLTLDLLIGGGHLELPF